MAPRTSESYSQAAMTSSHGLDWVGGNGCGPEESAGVEQSPLPAIRAHLTLEGSKWRVVYENEEKASAGEDTDRSVGEPESDDERPLKS